MCDLVRICHNHPLFNAALANLERRRDYDPKTHAAGIIEAANKFGIHPDYVTTATGVEMGGPVIPPKVPERTPAPAAVTEVRRPLMRRPVVPSHGEQVTKATDLAREMLQTGRYDLKTVTQRMLLYEGINPNEAEDIATAVQIELARGKGKPRKTGP